MKIDAKENKLVIEVAPKGAKERTDFFSSLRGVIFQEWLGENVIVYDTTAFSLHATALTVRLMESVAERIGFEITENARILMGEIALKDRDEQELKGIAEAEQAAKKRAIAKQQQGCGLCTFLKVEGRHYVCAANGKPCATDMRETERLFEEWKLTKIYRRETPFPNEECQYLEVMR